MGVKYNVTFKIKDNAIITEEELENIITRKLLKVILNLENSNIQAVNIVDYLMKIETKKIKMMIVNLLLIKKVCF